MIALENAFPLIRGVRGTAVALECAWLRVAIHDAAVNAGYHSWWLVDDLVAGISLYLRKCYVSNVIDHPELEQVVRKALRSIGYDEVAARFRIIPPLARISLVQCLHNPASNNRAKFFEKLAEAITQLYKGDARYLYFYDLNDCVNQLRSEEGSACLLSYESLREKIVSFVRDRVHSHGWNHKVWCSIT